MTDAEPAGPAATPPAITGVSHLSLSVRDLDRSLAFYRDTLGLPVIREPYDGEVFRGRQVMLLAGRILVALQQHDDVEAADFAPTRVGLDHLSFDVRDRDELERWRERLTSAGVATSPVKDVPPFGCMIELRDPDGIQLELFTTSTGGRR